MSTEDVKHDANDEEERKETGENTEPTSAVAVDSAEAELKDEGALNSPSEGEAEDERSEDDVAGANDDVDEHESSSDEDEESSDDDNSSNDGQGLSAYEKRRLERIRRNEERLASLGLETAAKIPNVKRGPRKYQKKAIDPSQRRSTLSRRSKEDVKYIEMAPRWSNVKPKPKKERKRSETKPPQQRMERFIYHEFRRIEATRKANVKNAEKYVRWAEIEVKNALKNMEVHERRLKRKLEIDKLVADLSEERKHYGGSQRDLLHDVDRRLPEIMASIREFDQRFFVSVCGGFAMVCNVQQSIKCS